MAGELKLTKMSPSSGTDIDIEANITVGTDAIPKALEVKGNLTVGVDIEGSGDLTIGGDVTAENFHATQTPTLDTHLITKAYLEDVGGMSQGYLYGFEISNGSIPDSEIDIEPGICKDSTNTRPITLSAGTTIDITASGAGGLDTGTVANDTWYYIWAIYSTSTGMADAMFSASATSPTMPSGYDYKRRVRGAVLTDGTADIITFDQIDNYFIFTSKIVELDTLTPATSKTNLTVSIPDSLTVMGLYHILIRDSTASYINIFGYNQSDAAPAQDECDFITEAGNMTGLEFQRITNNASISYRSSNAAMDNFTISTIGFIDPAQD